MGAAGRTENDSLLLLVTAINCPPSPRLRRIAFAMLRGVPPTFVCRSRLRSAKAVALAKVACQPELYAKAGGEGGI